MIATYRTVTIMIDIDMVSWRFAAGCTGKRMIMSFSLFLDKFLVVP